MSEFINQNSELENNSSLATQENSTPSSNNFKKPRKKLKTLGYSFVFILTFLAVFTSQILVSDQSSTSWFSNLPILKQIKDFVQGS